MADYTSDLDCVRTFLLKVHTPATTKHIDETAKITRINDTQRIMVYQGELMGSNGDDFFWKRYKVVISETSAANLITALNNIFIGIKKFNKRTAITGFTRPATMCHMKYGKSTEAKHKKNTPHWMCELWIDVEWSTS